MDGKHIFCTSFAKLLPGEYGSFDNFQIAASSMYFSALVLWAVMFTQKTTFYATFLGSSTAACGLLTTLGLHTEKMAQATAAVLRRLIGKGPIQPLCDGNSRGRLLSLPKFAVAKPSPSSHRISWMSPLDSSPGTSRSSPQGICTMASPSRPKPFTQAFPGSPNQSWLEHPSPVRRVTQQENYTKMHRPTAMVQEVPWA